MRLKLYYARGSEIDSPANEGLEEALKRLPHLEAKDIPVEIVDSNKLSREELRQAYFDACQPAVIKHIGVRLVFGSRRRGGGPFFGKEIPALLVYEEAAKYPTDVYPHQEPGGGPVVTINDFISVLMREGEAST